MENVTFINEFLSIGFNDYFNAKKSDSFERHIVECLADIYGKEEIKKVYDSKDENGFIELIKKYGFKDEYYDNFLRDMVKYETFKKENIKNPAIKSDRASIIEVSVINMYLRKCLVTEPTLEELSHFENDLLNDFSIIKMHFNTSLNPNRTREFWNRKKKILSDDIDLVEIKPEYLDEFTYAKYGINIKDVKKMDYRMVAELNSYIRSKQESAQKDPMPKNKFNWNTAVSTGNGYVDALLIISIIVTEMSIGFIYLILHI